MTDIVIVSNERAKKAHQELYHLSNEAYRIAGDDLLKSVEDIDGISGKLQISGTWRDILRLALWVEDPVIGDIFIMLKNIGAKQEELMPFKDADVNDIFPWLYYGRRFDMLRKICLLAKGNIERHMKQKGSAVPCHLVSEDTGAIVASSL